MKSRILMSTGCVSLNGPCYGEVTSEERRVYSEGVWVQRAHFSLMSRATLSGNRDGKVKKVISVTEGARRA